MSSSIFLFVLGVLCAAVGQIALKKGASREAWSLRSFLNSYSSTGYLLMVISTCLGLVAFRHLPLKLGPALDSLGYIFVPVLSWCFLHERLTLLRVLGFFLILCGVLVFMW